MSTSKQPHGNTGNRHAVGHGRPKRPGGGRVQQQISMSEQQQDELRRRAAEAGMTISAYLLTAAGL